MHTEFQEHPSSSPEGYASSAGRVDGGQGLATVREQNQLLRALPAESLARLLPHLEPIAMRPKDQIWKPHAPIEWVHFPRNCVMSLLVPLKDEKSVEAATVGCEGFVGVPVVLGAEA